MSDILSKDFSYSVKYDYETRYSCKESGCDSICRCGEIYDARIVDVDMDNIVSEIYNVYFDNSVSTKRDTMINSLVFGTGKEIDLYTIDRILRKFKVWDKDNWQMEIEGGYYGQEMGDITIRDSVAREIESHLEIAFSIDELSGRIEYLLGLEYGHLLPELAGCKYEIIEVNKDDIISESLFRERGVDGVYHRIKNKKFTYYSDSNYSGIRGIVLGKERKAGNQWKLIDGHHRCSSTTKDKVKVLKAYN